MNQSLPVSWSGVKFDSAPQKSAKEKLVSAEQLSNFDLIVRCQASKKPDRVAFTELMSRYESHVHRLFYHLAPDWQERADLAQEVWIRVFKNIHRLNEPNKFRGWLSRIVTNLFYDELRKRKRVARPISLDAPVRFSDSEMSWELPSDLPSPTDNLATQEFYGQLREAISSLPETFRTTIVLREIQGLPYEEIAEITGVSLGTVKSRIARARIKLQSILQNYLKEE